MATLIVEMAEQEVLKNMVLGFRVSELQVLLGYAGRNKSGRKQELQQRALELLQMRSTAIMMKIRELHRKEQLVQGKATPSDILPTMDSSSSLKSAQYHPPSGSHSSYPSIPPSQTSMNYRSSARLLQNDMNGGGSGGAAGSYPVHPDVRLKPLPFYDIMADLMRPTSLVPANNSRFQESRFIFHLTPQQAQDIAMSREVRTGPTGARLEHFSTQVQLRFCFLETSCPQDDNFPPSICVKVNDKVCPLPNPIPTNKPGVEPKRPGRPVNITALCRLSPVVSNYIDVSWGSDLGRGYVVSAYLVNKLTSGTLLNRLKSSMVRNADHTKAFIKEKLTHDMDSEIATTSLKVSLMCPLGKSRMQLPCRASTCMHIQCFDGMLYLQMNEKKATWICPVCDQSASFEKLVIDGLFVEIVQQAPSGCTEVKFMEDGSWSPLLLKKESSSVGLKHAAPKVYNVPAQIVEKKPKHDVIDLTLSSDEDDDVEPEDVDSPPVQPTSNNKKISTSSSSSSPMPKRSYYSSGNSSSSYSAHHGVEPPIIDLPTYKSMMSASEHNNAGMLNNSSSSNLLSTSALDKHLSSARPDTPLLSRYYNSLSAMPNLDREPSQLGLGIPTSSQAQDSAASYSEYLANPMFSNFDLYSLLQMSGVEGGRSLSMPSPRGQPSNNQSSQRASSAEGSPPEIIPLD